MGWSHFPDVAAAPQASAAGSAMSGLEPSNPHAVPRVNVLAQFAAKLFPAAAAAAAATRTRLSIVPVPARVGEPRVGNAGAARDVSADDRDLLFAAVAARLRGSVEARQDVPSALRTTVLECVEALDQMHGTLAHDRDHGHAVERELRQARAALAAAQLALAGTQARERRARHDAEHDSLTLLPNRSHFRAQLDATLGVAEHGVAPLAVLFLDLDGFKPINDRHGHDTGDELLRIVAQRLSRSIRAGDTVCRLGGDEFACLLRNPMGRDQLSQLAAKLFDAVSAPLKVGELKLIVRPSIGIALCPTDGTTAASLLKRADTAMYRAKRRQLGFAFFDRRTDA